MTTTTLLPVVKATFFDSNGNPLAGGKVYTYVAGTTTPLATYKDSAAAATNTNPVILDANGQADIWLGTQFYKIVVKNSADVTQTTTDNVAGNSPIFTSPTFTTPILGAATATSLTLSTPLAVASGGRGTTLSPRGDLILASTASSSAAINFTGLSSTLYSQYIVVINGLVPATDATFLQLRISTGSGFLSSNYSYGVLGWGIAASTVTGSASDATWVLANSGYSCGNGANELTSYEVKVFDVPATYPTKRMMFTGTGLWSAGDRIRLSGGGEVNTNSAAIDGLSFFMSSGNISSGNFYLYGIRAS